MIKRTIEGRIQNSIASRPVALITGGPPAGFSLRGLSEVEADSILV